MNQKVICDRAFKCEEKNECEHSKPHYPETFHSEYSDRPDVTCMESDDCLDYKVRCIPIGIDFDIEELFTI